MNPWLETAPPTFLLQEHTNTQFPATAFHPIPIPTPQVTQKPSLFSSQGPEFSQHQLRRKTPSGTVDAGYDGSHVYMDPGPPAYKHILLPASTITPRPSGGTYASTPSHPNQQSLHANRFVDTHFSEWLTAPTTRSQYLPSAYHRTNNDLFAVIPATSIASNSLSQVCSDFSQTVNLLSFGHQPQVLGNSLQNYGYGPPSPAIGAPFHPGLLQPLSSIPYPQGYPFHQTIPQTQVYHHLEPTVVQPSIATNGALLPLGAWPAGITQPGSSNFKPTHSHKLSSSTSEVSGSGSGGHFPNVWAAGSLNLSQDEVLIKAHRAYFVLLAHIQQTRKANNAKSGEMSKQYVFPKPPRSSQFPKHLNSDNSNHDPNVSQIKSEVNAIEALNRGAMAVSSTTQGSGGNLSTNQCSYSTEPTSFFAATSSRVLNSPISEAQCCLETLSVLCEQSRWQWIDGIIIGGCLQYGLERYSDAIKWFQLAISVDSQRVEAVSNLAATMYTIGMVTEAEMEWQKALRISPNYLDSVEHLIGLIYHRNPKEAVSSIDFLQNSLRINGLPSSQESNTSSSFGTSGYSIPGCDNGRLVGLIHAKGSLLYSLKDIKAALHAFEEAVLISTGKKNGNIYSLVRSIQSALVSNNQGLNGPNSPLSSPLLLLPEVAKRTSHFLFANEGQLPGLTSVPDGNPRKAAMQATSSSLLSLAKILQDSLSSNFGVITQPAGVGDILALYYLSLSLQESPSTANNVGILLATVQQPAGHQTTGSNMPITCIPGITPGSGLSFALAYYEYGLKLDPHHVHLHTNLGSLLKDIGQLDTAIRVYEKAVSCDGTFDIALTNLANAVKDRGRIQDAIGYYKRAVAANPSFAEAVCGLSTALNSVCDWRGRGGVMLGGGKFDQWHVSETGGLLAAHQQNEGSGLAQRVSNIVQRQLMDASKWGEGVMTNDIALQFAHQIGRLLQDASIIPNIAIKIRHISTSPFEGSQIMRIVERFTRVAMWHWYMDRKNGKERPSEVYSRLPVPLALTVPATPTILPFHTFTCPLEPRHVRMISQRNAMRTSCSTLRSPWIPNNVYPPPRSPNPQLIVGYVSSDFNNHPLAHLDQSSHRLKIEQEAPVFRDVSSWSSSQLIQQILDDGIHILVNLNGYTRGARNEIFAARPAPIQMSFMGFAGTMGAEWCDYLLADKNAIPLETLRPSRNNMTINSVLSDENDKPEGDWIYSENIIFTRDTFFCCDHAQSAASEERHVTWPEEEKRRWDLRRSIFPQLADDVIIMGNFNQLYKIDPTTFRTWLRILTRAPKAILWLLRFPELGEANLKRTAQEWAGSAVANRIVFTDVAQKQHHISRARVCDIFLDTAECNAHTTAADILWSSTPLLTLPRYPYKMCSRMASSILKGAFPRTYEGFEATAELTVANEEEYENTAVRLVNSLHYTTAKEGHKVGHGRLAELRHLLFNNRWNCGLFDTRRWVRDLEESFSLAWDRWERFEPGDIFL
ncbi:putative tetratricopeptide [Ceratocystis lukuohia]|uniref:protein O-GlcNAc transferase n=1 Tax=Ceratocystis lukuohia TaxID=2019550 RepID=A0ABR4MIU4_9PEZI